MVTRMLMDASALFKRYNQELGRARVMQLSAQAQVLVVAAHCRTEIASALNRQRHDGVLNDTDYAHILDVVQRDFGAFDVVPIDRRVEGFAISAMQRARLRGMDAHCITFARLQHSAKCRFLSRAQHVERDPRRT